MVTLSFPKLDKALMSNTNLKDLDANDPRRGIIVVNGHAIVLAAKFCIVVDLREHFIIDCGITDENEIKELDAILFYMNGKVFVREYWSELTKGGTMKMHEGMIYLKNPNYAKDLHFIETEINGEVIDISLFEPLSKLKEILTLEEKLTSAVAIPFGSLLAIGEILKAELKMDNIIFQFSNPDKPVKFTFDNKKHFFGFVYPNYNAVQSGFRFHNYETFIKHKLIDFLIEEHTPAPVPDAPNEVTMEIVKDLNQGDMFGPNIMDHNEE